MVDDSMSLQQNLGCSRPGWQKLHKVYQNLIYLTVTVNKSICYIVFIAFVFNIYHLCLQLYIALNPLEDVLAKIYFVFSFLFILLRTIVLSICTARVQEEASTLKPMLFAVKSHDYCPEVEVFTYHVCHEHVGISAYFFSVTRKVIVTVVGLSVAYEVVMFQLNTFADDSNINSMLGSNFSSILSFC